ncbi:alpha/beta hydrolase [Stenotrophomonas sp. HITSZ_GD]|uniref:alpha/beta fold hydrolase n=1 Tax=Stenotrophomonas sp. HITSZ_GD TaxID=3037248 RepID=UPI00240E73E0|nr:alpha/beta hydrolase [Stenotrophomonas sp. HITSZ_GD]MDG2525151.1 alpha/beta hydrolase [Stenotrophomonas sp. HITSZ_GD]
MSDLPFVLVHGLIGTLQHDEVLRHFPAGTLAPALLGYGPHAGVAPHHVHLEGQVEHLHACITAAFGPRPVVLVGHSVGGVVAALYAARYPARVAQLVSVEGNFTLRDAFWSSRVAQMTPQAADEMLLDIRQDPVGWLAGSGVAGAERMADLAMRLLDDQPASTIRAMARSVVEVTGKPDYLDQLHDLMHEVPIHLLAGERTREGWDVPDWAIPMAASFVELPDVGHMMMLEDAAGFAAAVRSCCRSLGEPLPA